MNKAMKITDKFAIDAFEEKNFSKRATSTRAAGPVRGRKKKSTAERRSRRCGVFRRSLILYRCHREEHAYS